MGTPHPHPLIHSQSVRVIMAASKDSLISTIDAYLTQIDEKLTQVPKVNEIAQKIGTRPVYIPVILIVLAMVFCNLFDVVLVALVSTVYPAYLSFKAVRSKTGEDDKQWLTYWCVYGFVNCFDVVLGDLLRMMPFYSFLKIALFVYLSVFKGSIQLYNLMEPHFQAAEPHVDDLIRRMIAPATEYRSNGATGTQKEK